MPLFIKLTVKGLYIRIKSLYSNSDCCNNYILAAYEMNGVSGVTFSSIFGLFKIINSTKKILQSLTVPLSVINSLNDEIVSIKLSIL